LRSSGPKVGSQDWFDLNQGFLLWLANTRAGRDMLCIRRDVPQHHSIIRLRPNGFDTVLRGPRENFRHALWGLREAAREGRPVEIRADFRCRPKIANRLATSWVRNVPAWNRYLVDTWDRVGSPFRMQPAFAASPLTAYPDPHVEIGTTDGHVLREVLAGTTWSDILSGAGTSSNDSATGLHAFYIKSHATSGWVDNLRGIMAFDTSSITSNIVTGATLSIVVSVRADALNATPDLNVYSATIAANPPTALAAGDYAGFGATAYTTTVTYANLTGTLVCTLNSDGIANIKTASVSIFGTRCPTYDVVGIEPPWLASQISRLYVYSADTTGTTSDPKLVVTYTAAWPYVGSLSQLGIGI